MDKFQEVATQRLEEIIERIKEHRLDSIDRDEAIERKLTNKIGNFVKMLIFRSKQEADGGPNGHHGKRKRKNEKLCYTNV